MITLVDLEDRYELVAYYPDTNSMWIDPKPGDYLGHEWTLDELRSVVADGGSYIKEAVDENIGYYTWYEYDKQELIDIQSVLRSMSDD